MPTKDLNTPWTNYPVAMPDAGGDTVVSRGGDPQVRDQGGAGLDPIWDSKPVPTPGLSETANSQSGLPKTPSRVVPAPASPPMPPSLQDRSPGTIDER